MKAKTQRVLFRAIIAIGVVLPWLTVVLTEGSSGWSEESAFRSLAELPGYPLAVILLTAWWSFPFVLFAILWRRLFTAGWRPLRRDPLLILLAAAIAIFPWAIWGSTGALFALAFLAYGTAATPSWGLRTPVSKVLFSLFGFIALVLITLMSYGLYQALGGNPFREHFVAVFSVLNYLTYGLLIGYLFAKPIDMLITHGEPAPVSAEPPRPTAWLAAGNIMSFGVALAGTLLLYSRVAGTAVSRFEIAGALSASGVFLALSSVVVGAVVGIAVFLLALVLLRRGYYPRGKPTVNIALAILPGLLIGLAPGLFGERAVRGLLASDYLGSFIGYRFGEIDRIAVSPDGTRIAADETGTLTIWHVTGGDLILRTRYEPSGRWAPSAALSWSPDSQRLAVAPPSIGLKIIDGSTGRGLLTLPLPLGDSSAREHTIATAFSPDGRWLTAATTDGGIYRYDLSAGTLEQTWQSPVPAGKLRAAALSPDGGWLAVSGTNIAEAGPAGGFVAAHDAQTGETRFVADDLEYAADRLEISPDGSVLLTDDSEKAPRLIDGNSGRSMGELRHHCPPPKPYRRARQYAAFLGRGDSIVTACSGGTVEVCATAGGECRVVFELMLMTVYGLAAHPDGRHVAIVLNGSTVALWDLDTAEPRQVYRLP
jgi:hypothetical protein